MTPAEIIDHCNQQIEICGPDADILLLIPGHWGKRNTRRLWPGGPRGEIVEDNMDGRGLRVMFNAVEVRRYLSPIPEECTEVTP